MLGNNGLQSRRIALSRPSVPLAHSFHPGDGTPGGVRSGFASFLSGLGGFKGLADASTDVELAPGAAIDPRFSQGAPGTYVVTMIVEGAKLNQSPLQFDNPDPYTKALRAKGLNATVTNVKFIENRNARDENWAASTLQDVFGSEPSDSGIVDLVYEITVQIDPTTAPGRTPGSPSDSDAAGLSGMGVVQIGVGAVVAIIGVIAITLAVICPPFRQMVLEGVRFVGELLGGVIGGATRAISENFIPILGVVAIGALSIWMLKKGGAKYASKSGRFSF